MAKARKRKKVMAQKRAAKKAKRRKSHKKKRRKVSPLKLKKMSEGLGEGLGEKVAARDTDSTQADQMEFPIPDEDFNPDDEPMREDNDELEDEEGYF